MNQTPNVQRFRQSPPSGGENFDSRPSYAASRPVHNGRTYETQREEYPNTNRVNQAAQATLSRSTQSQSTGSSFEQMAINRRLFHATDIRELESIYNEHKRSFNAVSLATTWNKLAKLAKINQRNASRTSFIQSLQELTPCLLTQCGSRELANIAWALAKLGIYDNSLMQDIANEAINKINHFKAQELANTAWAFATLGIRDNHLMQAIANATIRTAHLFDAQGLSITAWAFAKVNILNNILMQAIAKETIRNIHSFNAQNLANTAWAFATLGIRDDHLMQATADATIRTVHLFKAQELVNTAWAFAKVSICNNNLMQAIANETIRNILHLNAQDLANTAWAFAKVSICNNNLMQAIANETIRNIHSFNAQKLANTAWAFASLGICDTVIMRALADQIIYTIHNFNAQELANTAWAFAVCDFEDRKLLGVLADHLHQIPLRGALGENVNQLLQVQDWLRLKGSPFTFAIPSNWPRLSHQPTKFSLLQADVSSYVKQYAHENHLEVHEEYYDISFHHAIDLVVTNTSSGQKLAIEVDGPHHFNTDGTALGSTLFRNRLIDLAGYHFFGVCHLDWDSKTPTARETWIHARLDEIFQRNPTRGTKRQYPQDAPVRAPQRQAVQQA